MKTNERALTRREPKQRRSRQTVEAVLGAVRTEAKTALEILPAVYDQPVDVRNATWFLSETLSYLRHLQRQERVSPQPDGDVERWLAN